LVLDETYSMVGVEIYLQLCVWIRDMIILIFGNWWKNGDIYSISKIEEIEAGQLLYLKNESHSRADLCLTLTHRWFIILAVMGASAPITLCSSFSKA